MLPADLKDRLSRFMTPRRRRYTFVFAALYSVYTVFGFFVLPSIIQTQATAFVKNELHLDLTADRIEFNPWRLALRVDKFAIKDPSNQQEIFVAARSFYLNIDLLSSLWVLGAGIHELDLLEPYINARILKDGNLNLMKLVPADDEEPASSSPNWRIGTLGIHQGRVDFHDDSRPTPFSTTFTPLNIALADLSSSPKKDGGYTLHAETGEGEALDWKGLVALNPLRSEGELQISGLKATTPWRYLQDELPVVVERGLISISGKYHLEAGDTVTFALKDGRLTVDDFVLSQKSDQPLQTGWKNLTLQGVSASWPEQSAAFGQLDLQGIFLLDKKTTQPLVDVSGLTLKNMQYAPRNQVLTLATLAMKDLTLASKQKSSPLFTLPHFLLSQIETSLTAQTAHIARIQLSEGRAHVTREKNGELDVEQQLNLLLERLAKFSASPSVTATANNTPSSDSAEEKPWLTTLGELDLNHFQLGFTDLSLYEPLSTSLQDINLRLFPRQNDEESHRLDGQMRVASGGEVALKGSFSEAPLAANVNIQVQALKLPHFAPFAADVARFALEKGSLNVDGQFKFAQNKALQASFDGNVVVNDFAANDLDMDERFLAWNRLAINGLNWQLAPERLSIKDIQANKPFIRVIVNEDQTINLSQVVVAADSTEAPAAKPSKTESAYPLKIDHIKVSDGSMLFADMSLRPQFATGIQSLDGDIKGLSSQPGSRATVLLKGQVDEYGKADIQGTLNPLAGDLYTDIGVKFSNVELTTLTPYSSKFAGYRIDKGKLSLDLNYKINNRKLNATNKVVLDQLTLGEKVKSPDATSLPLKLAVAILKDKNGVIDIDLPISGSLDDPQFKVGPIIWKALLNLLTKAATAPFSMMAGLVGGGENMDALAFTVGQHQLLAESANKLQSLAAAMAKRPGLSLEIQGSYDSEADAQALRAQKFEQNFQKRAGSQGNTRKVLEDMYREKLGSEALARLRSLNLKPADNNALQLSTEAYEQQLRHELIARETVLEGELRQLALDRARAIRNALVEQGQVEESRVFVMEPSLSKMQDNQVISKVSLAAP